MDRNKIYKTGSWAATLTQDEKHPTYFDDESGYSYIAQGKFLYDIDQDELLDEDGKVVDAYDAASATAKEAEAALKLIKQKIADDAKKSKNKMLLLVLFGVVAASSVGFFLYKKYK